MPLLCRCSGGSGLGNPLDRVPDANLAAGLAGSWCLRGTVTESGCEEVAVGDVMPDEPILTVGEGECSLDDDSEFGEGAACEAGGGTVGVVEPFDWNISGCELRGEQKMLLNYDEGAGRLNGEAELSITVSGACPEEVEESLGSGCLVKMDVAGSRCASVQTAPTGSFPEEATEPPATEPPPSAETEPGVEPEDPGLDSEIEWPARARVPSTRMLQRLLRGR